MISRRGFMKLLGAATALSAGGIALIDTHKTFFLPPNGGWHQSLRIRKISQYLINTDSYRTRYDATWDLPNGEGRQFHIDCDGDFYSDIGDEPAIMLLKDRMAADHGIPNSKQFILALPNQSCYVPGKYIYA
jgi:hypothetical protein